MSARLPATNDAPNTEPSAPFILFGNITHQLTHGPLDRASILHKRNQKATSSHPAVPFITKVAPKQTGSERPSSPKVPRNPIPLNTKQPHIKADTWTAITAWLATSPFEAPPTPASIVDPDPDPDPPSASGHRLPEKPLLPPYKDRLPKEHWLQVSKDIDLRMKACSMRVLPPVHSTPDRVIINHGIKCGVSTPQPQSTLSSPAKPSPLGQLEAAKAKEGDLDVRAKGKEQQPHAQNPILVSEAIRAKAKQLAADAMATYRREQERKRYVEGRARDIHGEMLQCRPFDMEAVRREFSEEEVRDIKRIVRELGFAREE